MYGRFPEVFPAGARVSAVSSVARRCKTSMVQFLSSLSLREPTLDLCMDAAPENMRYINYKGEDFSKGRIHALVDSLQYATLDPEAVFAPLVTDWKAASALLERPDALEKALYDCAAICQCMPDGIDLMHYLPFEEGCKLWSLKNKKQYLYHANSVEYGARRIAASAALAEDIARKADEAIAYIGVNGFHKSLAEPQTDEWKDFRLMCMASNLQFVFYRNKAGDVLVQVLQNERETSIPALGPGPFYPWPQLRAVLLAGVE